MDSLRQPAALIATLGTEAQVVTATLDLLLKRGEPIKKLGIVHTAAQNEKIKNSLIRLHEIKNNQTYPDIKIEFIPIKHNSKKTVTDVDTEQAGSAALYTLFNLIRNIKNEHYRIHLSIAGGRKTMSLYGMLAAQMLFEEQDKLWHLQSAGDFLQSKRLHPQTGDEVHLIPIPIIQWSLVSPILMKQIETDDPFAALATIKELQLEKKISDAKTFIEHKLTKREVDVASHLVNNGSDDKTIAQSLHISQRTVEHHLRSAYKKAELHWLLEDVTRTQLIALLNLYFATEIRGNP